MWIAIRPFNELLTHKRWNIEFFTGSKENEHESGYPSVQIGQLATESRATIDPQSTPDKLFTYLGLENIASLTGELVGNTKKRGSEILSRSKSFGSGNVLYGRLRPYLNKVFVAQGDIDNGICSGEFIVLVPVAAKVRPQFLRYLLASEYVTRHVARFQSGAALPRIPVSDLLQIKVPIPPLAHQEKIEACLLDYEHRRRALLQELASLERVSVDGLMESLQCGKPVQFP
jgi:hypothetical protein